VILEDHELFIEARGIELRIPRPFEAFESADSLVNASVY
jgi:hypothetical protein